MGVRYTCPICEKVIQLNPARQARLRACPHCRTLVKTIAAEGRRAETQVNFRHKTPESQYEAKASSSGGIATCTMAASEPMVESQSCANALPAILTEKPDAQWFVRAPQGGHYGPASNELMFDWIADGRVGLRSLVWRNDWKDWLPASRVFSGLLESSPVANRSPQKRTERSARYLDDKLRQTRPSVATIVLLAILGIVVAGIGLLVLLPPPS